MAVQDVTALELGHHAPRLQVVWIDPHAVGNRRQLEKSVADGPVRLVQFGDKPGHEAETVGWVVPGLINRKSTRLNSSHLVKSYAVFFLKKKKKKRKNRPLWLRDVGFTSTRSGRC